jgi:hypothetical protein
MATKDNIGKEPLDASQEDVVLKEEASEMKEQAKKAIQLIKEKASEEDPKLTPALTLRTILGGDFLTADMVRRQIWLFVLMVVFCIAYVAVRYQCQQDLLTIDKLENELMDAKYKALTSSSTLTEKCRESHVLDALKQNKDSLLHIADQPPYIINVPE